MESFTAMEPSGRDEGEDEQTETPLRRTGPLWFGSTHLQCSYASGRWRDVESWACSWSCSASEAPGWP